MAIPSARFSREEFARRGQEIYDRAVKSQLHAEDLDKFVAIDIESGDYEIDRDDFTAMERLRARRSDAQIWLMRAGRPTAYRIGWRPAPGEPE
jgi:hypothetical protein